MPSKRSQVHPTFETEYRVRNWHQYDAGLVDRGNDEAQHQVTLTNPVLIARTECTQAAWDRVGGDDERGWRGASLPIDSVSWEDVTITSDDEALKTASKVMGGGARLGQISHLTDEQLDLIDSQERLEVVDVSLGKKDRGFDITGHRYWFNHPWASSDVLLAIRTDLTPVERGLVQGDEPMIWIMPPDYPQRLTESLQDVELRKWK